MVSGSFSASRPAREKKDRRRLIVNFDEMTDSGPTVGQRKSVHQCAFLRPYRAVAMLS
jgi:hypothetical protein